MTSSVVVVAPFGSTMAELARLFLLQDHHHFSQRQVANLEVQDISCCTGKVRNTRECLELMPYLPQETFVQFAFSSQRHGLLRFIFHCIYSFHLQTTAAYVPCTSYVHGSILHFVFLVRLGHHQHSHQQTWVSQ